MEINVNVYDIASSVNKYVGWLGLGAYHTGVQIGQREYTFSNNGVIYHTPFEAGAEAVFKETLNFGEVANMSAVNAAVAELRVKFAPGTYDLTRQNCNHFTQALVQKLTGKSIPGYINRAAKLGSSFAPKDTTTEEGGAKKQSQKKAESSPKKQESTERKELSEKQKELLAKMKKKDG